MVYRVGAISWHVLIASPWVWQMWVPNQTYETLPEQHVFLLNVNDSLGCLLTCHFEWQIICIVASRFTLLAANIFSRYLTCFFEVACYFLSKCRLTSICYYLCIVLRAIKYGTVHRALIVHNSCVMSCSSFLEHYFMTFLPNGNNIYC